MRIKRVWVPTLTKTRVSQANEWLYVIVSSAYLPLHVRPLGSRAQAHSGGHPNGRTKVNKKSGMPQQAVGHSAKQCPYGKPGSTKRVAAARKAKKAQKATAHKAVKPVLEWSDSAESDAPAPTQADVVDLFNKLNKADKRAMAKSFEKAQMAKDTAKSAPKKLRKKKKKKKKRRSGSSSSSSA